MFSQESYFLSAATEQERIASFQAHHIHAPPRTFDQETVDLILREGVMPTMLADLDPLRVCRCLVEQSGRDETIVEDDLGRPQSPHSLDGQKLRIPGPGTDQTDLAQTPV